MADKTGIEWADATWNVLVGCEKVSPGCSNCYAIRTAHRMQANPNPKVSGAYAGTEAGMEWTGRVNLLEDRLDWPLRKRDGLKIFVNAQSDLFHKDVPDEFIAKVWAVMALAPRHTFQILTKRHGRMRSLLSSRKFRQQVWDRIRAIHGEWVVANPGRGGQMPGMVGSLEWPLPNVWLGVSVEDQKHAELRIPALLDTPAAVRWLSCEPLLGPVDLFARSTIDRDPGLDWIVVGGESGPGARPMHPEWARQLRDQCAAAGVPFLFKQWGEYRPNPTGWGHGRPSHIAVHVEGSTTDPGSVPTYLDHHGYALMERVGKKAAGRVLDGVTHDGYPQEANR